MNEMMNLRNNGRGTLNEFDRFLQTMFSPFTDFVPEVLGSGSRYPQIELETGDTGVTARLPLPGVRTKDIDVEVVGDMLTIRAKREEAVPRDAKGHYLKRERSCTEFEETVRLPVPVKGQDAAANYTDGVLTVTIPRETENKQSRKIPVK